MKNETTTEGGTRLYNLAKFGARENAHSQSRVRANLVHLLHTHIRFLVYVYKYSLFYFNTHLLLLPAITENQDS